MIPNKFKDISLKEIIQKEEESNLNKNNYKRNPLKLSDQKSKKNYHEL